MTPHLGRDEVGVLTAEVDDGNGVVLHGSSYVRWGVALGREYTYRGGPATLYDGQVSVAGAQEPQHRAAERDKTGPPHEDPGQEDCHQKPRLGERVRLPSRLTRFTSCWNLPPLRTSRAPVGSLPYPARAW